MNLVKVGEDSWGTIQQPMECSRTKSCSVGVVRSSFLPFLFVFLLFCIVSSLLERVERERERGETGGENNGGSREGMQLGWQRARAHGHGEGLFQTRARELNLCDCVCARHPSQAKHPHPCRPPAGRYIVPAAMPVQPSDERAKIRGEIKP